MRKSGKKLNAAMLLMIILLAANMRASYTGIGTIIYLIQDDIGLSAAAAGMITTTPILIFAVVCPAAPLAARRIGVGPMLEVALILIFAGSFFRAVLGIFGLFAGTVILSVGVGIMNALMVVLKENGYHSISFPLISSGKA